ncbi:MAG: Holliday junction resolvase RuvX [Ignavibacterium sp.]|nr:Holliday junction resolvase RuvX [Ignavibacterium sp.]
MNELENHSRIMSIDYGFKRVGIALTDPLKKFAYPYKTLTNDKSLINNIIHLINEMNVELVIVGIPGDYQKNPNSIFPKILEFKDNLMEKINIEIMFWDEDYSSKIAYQKILESVPKKKQRRNKELIDMHSAAVILSEYLQQLEN